jgi:outer membrane protein
MNLMLTHLFTIFVLCIVLNSESQEIWSHSDCIRYALKKNIRIKQLELNVETMKNHISKAKSNKLPSLNGVLSNSFNIGRSLTYENTYKDINSIQTDGYLATTLTLWKGFTLQNNLKKHKLNLQASLLDRKKLKNNIILNITASYLEILFAEELLSIDKEQIEMTKKQLDRTKNMIEAGRQAAGAILETEAQLARDNLQLVKDSNKIIMAYFKLSQLLELPADKKFRIKQPRLPVIPVKEMPDNLSEIIKTAINEQPQIKASELRIKSAKRQLDIARGGRYPSLSFGADYMNIYNNKYTDIYNNYLNIKNQLSNNKRYTMGFKLNIPLFNGFVVNYDIKNALLEVKQCEYELESTRNILRQEILQAWNDANAALSRYFAGKKAELAAEEAFRHAEEKLNVGLISSLDYYQSKNYLISARSELLQAKYEYIFRSKILDFYKGIPIEL